MRRQNFVSIQNIILRDQRWLFGGISLPTKKTPIPEKPGNKNLGDKDPNILTCLVFTLTFFFSKSTDRNYLINLAVKH